MATKFLIKVKQTGAKAAGKSLKALSSSMKGLAKAGKFAAIGTAAVGGAALVAGSKAVAMAGHFDKLESSFTNLNASAGFGEGSLNKYRKALDGTVSSTSMMEMANNAMLLGIADSSDQMAEMFDVAQRLGAAVGEDAAFGVNSLVTGMGRQSVLMLDNLGIMVDTEDANKRFAVANGKKVKDLTDVEKKTAFNNETMRQANILVAKLGDEELTTADKMAKLKAQMEDGAISIGQKLAPAFGKVLDILSGLADVDMVGTLKNHFNSIAQFQQAIIESFKIIFDSDIMMKALTGIKDGFLKVMSNLATVLKTVGTFLFEPLLMGGKIIAVKIGNFFIDMINGIKEQMNKVAGLFGGEGFELTPKISEEGLSMASTRMGEFIGVLTDDTKVSNEELASGLTDIWTKYADSVVVENEKIDTSNKKTTKAIVGGKGQVEKATKAVEKTDVEAGVAAGASADTALGAIRSVIKAKFSEMIAGLLAKEITTKGFAGVLTGAIGAGAANQLFNAVVPSFAQGGDFVTNGSQMIMVGDNPSGREHVKIEPLDSGGEPTGGGGSVVVNFSGNVMSQDFIENEAIPMIQAAVRRGFSLEGA